MAGLGNPITFAVFLCRELIGFNFYLDLVKSIPLVSVGYDESDH